MHQQWSNPFDLFIWPAGPTQNWGKPSRSDAVDPLWAGLELTKRAQGGLHVVLEDWDPVRCRLAGGQGGGCASDMAGNPESQVVASPLTMTGLFRLRGIRIKKMSFSLYGASLSVTGL